MRFPKGRREPKHRDKSELVVIWAKEPHDEPCLNYFWRNSEAHNDAGSSSGRRDTPILMEHFERLTGMFGRTLKEELIERGYDISTLKFTIEKLPV
ncbi:hypothetical protein D9M71_835720 [compost metagenome]